ncbi:MAG TPA: FG-GAP-like repeat-containing protein, partial [Candidatus Limnocylindrales bacterium]
LLAPLVVVAGSSGAAAAGPVDWTGTGWTRDTNLADARTGTLNKPIDGTSGRSGWFQLSSPTLADLDGDGKQEIVIGSLDGQVYAYRSDGTLMWKRYLDSSAQAGGIQGSPAVGDIDHDGHLDVVVGSENGWVFALDGRTGALKPGWPQFTGWNADYPKNCATDACTGVVSSATLADLDGDGTLEVIVGSYSHKLWVWNYQGQVLPGWPRDVWDGIASGAAVGDINGDGRPEIVIGSDVANDCASCPPFGSLAKGGLLHAFTLAGKELQGWPVHTDSFMHSTPALADLDGDGKPEVIAGAGIFGDNPAIRGRTLVALRGDGSRLWSFQANSQIIGAPTVGDVNGDGKPEIAIDDYAGYTYLLSASGSPIWSNSGVTPRAPNGSGADFAAPVLADVTGDGRPEVITADSNWHVKAFDAATGAVVADTGTTFPVWGSPAVGDIDGNGTNEVVAGSAVQNGTSGSLPDLAGAGRLYVWKTPGRGGLLAPQYQALGATRGTRALPIDRSLAPSDPAPGATTAKVYRFWSPAFTNAHFYTTSGSEAVHIIDTDANWLYEGVAFTALTWSASSCSAGLPVYRFHSNVYNSHFYTQSEDEKNALIAGDPNWTYEGVAYCAYPSQQAGSTPLYRFWSPVFGKHFFTASQAESDHIRASDPNWQYEGIAFYVLP